MNKALNFLRNPLRLGCFVLALISGVVQAQEIGDYEDLKQESQGAIRYSIFPEEKKLVLELPFLVNVSLSRDPQLPSQSRYLLSVFGQLNRNTDRSEVKLIQKKYPDYDIEEKSISALVRNCRMHLPELGDIPCDIPPQSGDYFSIFRTLPDTIGAKLSKQFSENRALSIRLSVDALQVKVKRLASKRLNLNHFCHSLKKTQSNTSLSVRELITRMNQGLFQEMRGAHSQRLRTLALDEVFRHCVNESLSTTQAVSSLSQLLNTPVLLRSPEVEFVDLKIRDLIWIQSSRDAVLEYQIAGEQQ